MSGRLRTDYLRTATASTRMHNPWPGTTLTRATDGTTPPPSTPRSTDQDLQRPVYRVRPAKNPAAHRFSVVYPPPPTPGSINRTTPPMATGTKGCKTTVSTLLGHHHHEEEQQISHPTRNTVNDYGRIFVTFRPPGVGTRVPISPSWIVTCRMD